MNKKYKILCLTLLLLCSGVKLMICEPTQITLLDESKSCHTNLSNEGLFTYNEIRQSDNTHFRKGRLYYEAGMLFNQRKVSSNETYFINDVNYGKRSPKHFHANDVNLCLKAGYFMTDNMILFLEYQGISTGNTKFSITYHAPPYPEQALNFKEKHSLSYSGVGLQYHLFDRYVVAASGGISYLDLKTTVTAENMLQEGANSHHARGIGSAVSVAYDMPFNKFGLLLGVQGDFMSFDAEGQSRIFETQSIGVFLKIRY